MKKVKTPMERFIGELLRDFGLPEDAEFSLDSIAFQEEKAEIPQGDIRTDLTYAATVAGRYSDPVAALKTIDKAMPIYLKRRSETRVRVGSFAQMNSGEARLASGKFLNLSGLDGRIHAYLIGDSTAR